MQNECINITCGRGDSSIQGDEYGNIGERAFDGSQGGLLLVGREGQDLVALQLGRDGACASGDRGPK